ncbi:hypothetical protein HMI55_004562 [Coelomomyces lativittatus]|nr:hypothetical protein HMI56_000151 [Coelomomyces lativittatus]KAJ1514546.1 hypothetical protein HMI55_004562 [Coelomomyces lativittatus]
MAAHKLHLFLDSPKLEIKLFGHPYLHLMTCNAELRQRKNKIITKHQIKKEFYPGQEMTIRKNDNSIAKTLKKDQEGTITTYTSTFKFLTCRKGDCGKPTTSFFAFQDSRDDNNKQVKTIEELSKHKWELVIGCNYKLTEVYKENQEHNLKVHAIIDFFQSEMYFVSFLFFFLESFEKVILFYH